MTLKDYTTKIRDVDQLADEYYAAINGKATE
jgi:hypothetical protein